jgi:hypothetical protein
MTVAKIIAGKETFTFVVLLISFNNWIKIGGQMMSGNAHVVGITNYVA